MDREQFEVIFDGAALTEHKMDVRDLAPALLGLGDTIRKANQKLNGDKATIDVFVNSGFEHGCFRVNLELAQTLTSYISSFLAADGVKNAKEVLEWLELLAPPGGLTLGVMGFLKYRKGRKIQDVREVKDADKSGMVSVHIEGDHNPVVIHQHVYNLSTDPAVTKPLEQFVSTILKPGIETIAVRSPHGVERALIETTEARDIVASCEAVADQSGEVETNTVTANLVVHTPTLAPDAGKWRFLYGGKDIAVDISETKIAQEAIARGGVGVGDTYRVEMEVKEWRTAGGQYRHDYKILNVLQFTPGAQQSDFFFQLRMPPPSE